MIQGLIALEIREGFVETHLIETAPHNYGSFKKYSGVAANLFAFACKLSFSLGFGGYVSFTAKTQLIEHYSRTLGASLIYKDRMAITGGSAEKLVNSYFRDYLNEG